MVALTWLAFVVAVLGVVYGVYARNSPRSNRVVYFVRAQPLVPSRIGRDLSITFQGAVLPCLSRTVVGVWNQGPRPLSGEMIPKTDRLRIDIAANAIVGAPRVTHSSHSRISPLAVVDTEAVLISFELFESGDYFEIDVLHTSEDPVLCLTGSIAGVRFERRSVPMVFPPAKLLAAAGLLLAGFALTSMASGILLMVKVYDISSASVLYAMSGGAVVLGLAAVLLAASEARQRHASLRLFPRRMELKTSRAQEDAPATKPTKRDLTAGLSL